MPPISSAPFPTFSPAAREEMRASLATFRAEFAGVASNVRGGLLSPEAGIERMRGVLSGGYERAYRQGLSSLGVTRYTDWDAACVKAAVDREMRFVDVFVRDMVAGTGTMSYGVRAATYARGYESLYTVGQVQALPWETDIWWRLSAADHCKDCMSLADASPFSKATMPVVPGSGGTQCLYNCGCYLEYDCRQTKSRDLESRPGRLAAMERAVGELPEGKRLPGDSELEEIRAMWGRIQFHRMAVRYYPVELKAAHVAARRDANDALVNYLDQRGLYWTRGMEDDLFNPPPGGGEGAAAPTGRAGVSSGGPRIEGAGTPVLEPSAYTIPVPGIDGPEDAT